MVLIAMCGMIASSLGMLAAGLARSKNFKLVLMIGTAVFALGTAGLALSSDLVLLYGLQQEVAA